MMWPYALIFGGWVVASALAAVLGPLTNYSFAALFFALIVGDGCSVAAVVIS